MGSVLFGSEDDAQGGRKHGTLESQGPQLNTAQPVFWDRLSRGLSVQCYIIPSIYLATANFLVVPSPTNSLQKLLSYNVLYYSRDYVKIDSIKCISHPFRPISTNHRPLQVDIYHCNIIKLKHTHTHTKLSSIVMNKSCFQPTNIGSARNSSRHTQLVAAPSAAA